MLVIVLCTLTLASVVYVMAAGYSARRFFRQRIHEGNDYRPSVSVLKPIQGVDGRTYADLASFCHLDYPDYELLFGVSDPNDPAIALIQRLQRNFPDQAIRLVVVSARGVNPKSSILTELASRSRREVLAVSDSDIRVGPDYLSRVVTPLEDPRVGAVTCLYRNESWGSLIGQLAALYLAADFFPSAILANRTFGIGFCLGATIVLRRTELMRFGGYAGIADHLADDYQIGAKVAASGRRVWLSEYVVTNVTGRPRLREQWYREVRWARGIRVNRPHQYFGLLLTQTTPLAVCTALAGGLAPWTVALLTAAPRLRWLVAREMIRRLHVRISPFSLLCLPLRDAWSSVVWAAGLFGRQIVWRGHIYLLEPDGRLKVRL